MVTKINVWREAGRLLGDYRIAELTDDSVQRYAFDDAWGRAIEYTLRSAYWKFAMRTRELDRATTVDPLPGYNYVYELHGDWLRSHAIYAVAPASTVECPVDCKHTLNQIHTNVSAPWIRYVSNNYADPATWPEHFAHAVAGRLAYETAERITGNPAKTEQALKLWRDAMAMAIGPDALPENPWLRFQLDGSMLAGCKWLLDEAFWRFAVKTETLTGLTVNVSPGYTYAADKPADFGRTFHYYVANSDQWTDIDFRDEDGMLHSQYQTTVLRYVSTDGEDATTWSDGFRRALLAYLEFEEAKRNPQSSGAGVQARAMAWQEAFKNARIKDDLTERARLNTGSRISAARRAGGSARMNVSAGGWSDA